MKKIVYMVKKDVSLPNQSDNWLLLSGKEFKEFIGSHDMNGRYFANLGGEEDASEIYIAECSKEQCRKWTAEYERHKYLRKVEKESNVVVFLESQLSNDGAELSLDDITASDESLIEDDFILRSEYEVLRLALKKLPVGQRRIIELTYFPSLSLSLAERDAIYSRRINAANNEAKTRGVKKITPNQDEWLSETEVAKFLSISQPTVHEQRCDGLKKLKKFLS